MKSSILANPKNMITLVQDEIRRSNESCYDHRLHAILLVAKGLHINQVAQLLGHSSQHIEHWVKRFEMYGFTGLTDSSETVNQMTELHSNSHGSSVEEWHEGSLVGSLFKDSE